MAVLQWLNRGLASGSPLMGSTRTDVHQTRPVLAVYLALALLGAQAEVARLVPKATTIGVGRDVYDAELPTTTTLSFFL